MFETLPTPALIDLAFDAERRIGSQDDALALLLELAKRLRELDAAYTDLAGRYVAGELCEGRR